MRWLKIAVKGKSSLFACSAGGLLTWSSNPLTCIVKVMSLFRSIEATLISDDVLAATGT